jgi:HK97 gp10 family phage protein
MPRPFRTRTGPVSYEIDTTRLNQILQRLPGNLDQNIRAVAFAIEAKAKVKAPFETGALRSSIYTRTSKKAYSNGKPLVGLPDVQGNPPREELPRPKAGEAVIGPSVEYGIYQELGTGRMTARPYLGPAVNSSADELERAMANVVTDGE